jgi:hypothetical protein
MNWILDIYFHKTKLHLCLMIFPEQISDYLVKSKQISTYYTWTHSNNPSSIYSIYINSKGCRKSNCFRLLNQNYLIVKIWSYVKVIYTRDEHRAGRSWRPVLCCPSGQDITWIFVLSCRPPGQKLAGQQGRTGRKNLSCAHLCLILREWFKVFLYFSMFIGLNLLPKQSVFVRNSDIEVNTWEDNRSLLYKKLYNFGHKKPFLEKVLIISVETYGSFRQNRKCFLNFSLYDFWSRIPDFSVHTHPTYFKVSLFHKAC